MQHDVAEEALRHPSHAQHRAVHHEPHFGTTQTGLCRVLGRSRQVDVRKPGWFNRRGEDQRRFRAPTARGPADDPGAAGAVHRARALHRRGPGGRAAAAGAGRPVRGRHVDRRSPTVPAGGQHQRQAGRRHRPRRHACPCGDRRSRPEICWPRSAPTWTSPRGRPSSSPGSRTRSGGCCQRGALARRAGGDRHRTARPRRAPDRPGDQPADHAGVGPLRRPHARPPVLRRARCSSTTTSTSWRWVSSAPSSPTCRTSCCSRSRPGSARASSPAACCSGAPRERPATWGTSASAAPREDLCRCGNIGCVEAVAAGPAIARVLRAHGTDAAIGQRCGRPGAGRRPHRDPGGARGRARHRRRRGDGRELHQPGCRRVGGTLAEAGEHLIAGIREEVYRRSLPLATEHLQIVASATGERSGVLGAAAMAISHVLSPEAIERASQDLLAAGAPAG